MRQPLLSQAVVEPQLPPQPQPPVVAAAAAELSDFEGVEAQLSALPSRLEEEAAWPAARAPVPSA